MLLSAKQDNLCNLVSPVRIFVKRTRCLYTGIYFDDSYRALCKRNLNAFTRDNGLSDTLSFYMDDFMVNREVAQLLLSAY